MRGAAGHVGELALRRLRAGEAVGDDVAAHAAACPECRARAKALDDEQRRFERDISFDRFAAGVERAARGQRARRSRPPSALRAWMGAPVLAAAAAVALVVTFGPGPGQVGPNRTKGGAEIDVRVRSGDGAQRAAAADAPEALAKGDRVRIGYKRGDHRYLLAVSVDDQGQVTAIYPESGQSLAVGERAPGALDYLPDSVEFTGAGAERLIVVLSDRPLDVGAARRAARAAYDRARGDVVHLPALELPGEQFQRTFVKP